MLPAESVASGWMLPATEHLRGGGWRGGSAANRNRTPYRRAEACAPAPAAARNEPHLAQQPVHAGRADLQQKAADLGVNRQSTVPLERGKQHGHERLEAFRADPVRSLPHCDQRFADRIAVTAAGPPLRRRPLLPGPQQSDRVLAMIAADRNKFVQDYRALRLAAARIPFRQRRHQFVSRRHPDRPRHPPPRRCSVAGSIHPEATDSAGNIQGEAMRPLTTINWPLPW